MDAWIESLVAGRTFIDVGGIGLEARNEKVTLAARAGAARLTMADIRPATHPEWEWFHGRCRAAGVTGYYSVPDTDINDPALPHRLDVHDIVHCTGVVYHLPNPVWGLTNLARIVGEYLIVNTVVAPPVMATQSGTLRFGGSTAVFMPGLSDEERTVIDEYYRAKFGLGVDHIAPRITDRNAECPWFENGVATCWPWWWLFTAEAFRGLIELIGFEILDSALWENHALAFLTRRRASEPSA